MVLSGEGMKSQSMNAYAKILSQSKIKGAERRSTLLSYFAESGHSKMKAVWLVWFNSSLLQVLNIMNRI